MLLGEMFNFFYFISINMNRGYRIRYGSEPYVPTRLSVNTMTGVEHILFTERDGETYGDVKNALLPHIRNGSGKTLLRCQLSFIWKNADGSFTSDNDNDLNNQIIPPGEHPDIHIIIKEQPTWTAEQQPVITKLSGIYVDAENGDVGRGTVELNDIDTPAKMEACLWSIQNNPIRYLKLRIPLTPIMHIMNFMEENPYTEFLILETHLNENETAEFFERIGRNNTIRSLILKNISYRINDLADCLRVNTSLRNVNIQNCNVRFDEHTTLANVLVDHPTLRVLGLTRNIPIADFGIDDIIAVGEDEHRFLDSLLAIGAQQLVGEGFNVMWRSNF